MEFRLSVFTYFSMITKQVSVCASWGSASVELNAAAEICHKGLLSQKAVERK